jgi:hypothetical protein
LKTDDLAAITAALRALTAVTGETGCRFDSIGLSVCLPSGDFYTVRWSDDEGGQYVLAVDEG